MYCPQCGTQNDDNAFRCIKCQEIIQSMPIQPQRPVIDDSPAMRMILPVGRSGLAIAAGYVGLFSVLCVPAPIALILGILAVIDIRRHPEKHGMGRAVFALIMGGMWRNLTADTASRCACSDCPQLSCASDSGYSFLLRSIWNCRHSLRSTGQRQAGCGGLCRRR